MPAATAKRSPYKGAFLAQPAHHIAEKRMNMRPSDGLHGLAIDREHRQSPVNARFPLRADPNHLRVPRDAMEDAGTGGGIAGLVSSVAISRRLPGRS
jgi:hypothetical protein